MPAFETHVRYGAAAHGVLFGAAFVLTVPTALPDALVGYAAVATPVTLLGAVVPDIDHPSARPYRLLRRYLPALVAGLVGIALFTVSGALRSVVAVAPVTASPSFLAGIGWCGTVWGTWRAVEALVPVLRPRHRGTTHRFPFGLLSAVSAAGVGTLVATAVAVPHPTGAGLTTGLAFLAGFGSHLHADGLLTDRYTYRLVR